MNKVAIIGAGISGISLCSMLSKKYNIKVFEKSRGPGGRMSTRRVEHLNFDHGAQYFKINNPDFKKFLSPLFTKKIIKPWECRFVKIMHNNFNQKKLWDSETKHYVGVPNMDSIVKYLAKGCDVSLNTKINSIKKVDGKWHLFGDNNIFFGEYNWVIYTMPAEQTYSIISKNVNFLSSIKLIKMKCCYSLMLGIDKNLDLEYDAALIENQDIAWLAVNSSKPNRNGENNLLINSSYDYAKKNSETSKDKILNHLIEITSKVIRKDLSKAKIKILHKWNYVEAEKHPEKKYFIDQTQKVAVCGDWCVDSRVEGAFISAKELSKNMNSILEEI